MSKAIVRSHDSYGGSEAPGTGWGLPLKGGRAAPPGQPRRWVYATKPFFARLHGPLADSLDGVDEVRLIMNLNDFSAGGVRLEIKPDRCLITANRPGMRFAEEIPLPKKTHAFRSEEHFWDGILELVLQRRNRRAPPRQKEKEN